MPKRSRKTGLLDSNHVKKNKTRTVSWMKSKVNEANETINLLEQLKELKLYKSTVSDYSFKITSCSYSECSQDLFLWMMNLLEENMASLYKLCDWGWDLNSKRSEMSNDKSRFLIAHSDINIAPVAFSHFRFDMDHDVSVLYCYELQLVKSARKQGLAKHLMKILEALCIRYEMQKVILTVFSFNKNAFDFFVSQGYKIDETSPENFSIETFYSILSKDLHSSLYNRRV